MAKQMTEAAKLYLEDFDVLEEARDSLVHFFDEVLNQSLEQVLEQWEDGADQGEAVEIVSSKSKVIPGGWNMNLKRKKGIVYFYVGLRDPRRTGDSWSYSVNIHAPLSLKKVLQRIGNHAAEALSNLAQEREVQLTWDDFQQLSVEQLRWRPEDADGLVDNLVQIACDRLQTVSLLENWIVAHGGLPTGQRSKQPSEPTSSH